MAGEYMVNLWTLFNMEHAGVEGADGRDVET
jgi:hypothetical protein